MANDILLLKDANGKILDKYLSKGWYRSGKFVFTTNIVSPEQDGVYPVYWLRYITGKVTLSAKNKKILELNRHFSVTIRKFTLTDDLKALHRSYIDSVNFTTAATLEDLLMEVPARRFDSYVIEVRDEDKLVAAGIFDKGTNSIAGIVNFYLPEYKKYSPGKYIMLLKHQYCLEQGIPLYYPGYYALGLPVFDYKLFLDKQATEVYLPGPNIWIPYFEFDRIIKNLYPSNG